MSTADKELKQLKEIKKELSAIKDRTNDPKRSFFNGILYGAGAFLGSIIAVVLIGWLLSIAGIIPGLDTIAHYLQALVAKLPSKW